MIIDSAAASLSPEDAAILHRALAEAELEDIIVTAVRITAEKDGGELQLLMTPDRTATAYMPNCFGDRRHFILARATPFVEGGIRIVMDRFEHQRRDQSTMLLDNLIATSVVINNSTVKDWLAVVNQVFKVAEENAWFTRYPHFSLDQLRGPLEDFIQQLRSGVPTHWAIEILLHQIPTRS